MKSKIEQKIEKAREATNEMFAAFDELNERLSVNEESLNAKRRRMGFCNLIALLDSKLAEQGKRFDKEKLELVDIPKFKEGDYFVLKMGRDKDGLRWLSSMESYIDKILIIDKISENGNIINKEVGYYFHPDWCEKTTAPKHKEPIIGEMAIFWDNKAKIVASCKIYDCRLSDGSHKPKGSLSSWNNAILFESPEQFKAFLKS